MEIALIRKKTEKYWVLIGFVTLSIILSYPKLTFYFKPGFNAILMVIALPLLVRQQSIRLSNRFGWLALLMFLLYPALKISTVYFLGFSFAMIFAWESRFGKLTSLPVFLLLIISPASIFLSNVIGFEIRLALTKIAVQVLSLISPNYRAEGNIILIDGQEFAVSPECMGLKMVFLSLALCLVFIAYLEKKKERQYKFYSVILALIITYFLVVLSNLFRIVIITLFESKPETFSHEIIGLITFIIYTALPIWFIIKALPQRPAPMVQQHANTKQLSKVSAALTIVLIGIIFLFRISDLSEKPDMQVAKQTINIDSQNYTCSVEELGVQKMVNDSVMLYIKPPVNFYAADHSPMICWRGGGYKINKEQIITIEGMDVYYAVLNQGEDKLYTTWWYDSGSVKTAYQLQWRIRNMLKREKFSLVNVISHDEQILLKKTKELLKHNLLKETP